MFIIPLKVTKNVYKNEILLIWDENNVYEIICF